MWPRRCGTGPASWPNSWPRYWPPAIPTLGDTDQIGRVLTEVADSYLNFQVVALREMEERSMLSVVPDVLASVPFFDTDIFDLAGLVRLGEQIWE